MRWAADQAACQREEHEHQAAERRESRGGPRWLMFQPAAILIPIHTIMAVAVPETSKATTTVKNTRSMMPATHGGIPGVKEGRAGSTVCRARRIRPTTSYPIANDQTNPRVQRVSGFIGCPSRPSSAPPHLNSSEPSAMPQNEHGGSLSARSRGESSSGSSVTPGNAITRVVITSAPPGCSTCAAGTAPVAGC
jgi:hypothetical protein